MRKHQHTEENNRHWGLPKTGGWEEGEDQEKYLMGTNTWMMK